MIRAAAGRRLVFATGGMTGLVGCLVGGCARGLPVCSTGDTVYVMVERTRVLAEGAARGAEVTEAASYRSLHGAFKTVVVRLPDACYQAATLGDSCAIPLQALESTLTISGYQVLSSPALVGIEHRLNVPAHAAAQQLGADFVLVVNDLHIGRPPASGEAEARYRYIVSDPRGTPGRPVELFQADREWLKKFVGERVGGGDAQPLEARLKATVVLARGATAPAPVGPGLSAPGAPGEAIWFYSWRLVDEGPGAEDRRGMRFLFGGLRTREFSLIHPDGPDVDVTDPHRHYWWPMAPVTGAETAEPTEAPRDRAASEERVARKVDVTQDDEAALYRKVAADLVQRFKGG